MPSWVFSPDSTHKSFPDVYNSLVYRNPSKLPVYLYLCTLYFPCNKCSNSWLLLTVLISWLMTWSTMTIWKKKKKNDWGGVWERKWEVELREIQNLTARLGKMNLPRQAKSRYSEANIGILWRKQREEYLEEKETVVLLITYNMHACMLSCFSRVRLFATL